MALRYFLLGLAFLAALGTGALLKVSRQGVAARPAALAINSDGAVSFSLGSPGAPVEVWVGSDYQCPDCSRYEEEAMPEIRRRFIETGKVRWRYLLFALPNHAEAVPATHAMACALEQGEARGEAMHQGLFASRAEWAKSPEHLDVFRRVAGEAGLALAEYTACMTSNRYASAVGRSWAEAQRVGIPGTPTVLVFDRFYVGGLTANQLERLLVHRPESGGVLSRE